MRVILETIHGSRLYGLARPDSDYDAYKVLVGHNKSYARQRLHEGDDRLGIHLSRFQEQVDKGVPQALEALFSPLAELEPAMAPFIRGLRPGIIQARATYRRTIVNFAHHHGGRTGSAKGRADMHKLRRHAVRLCVNLSDLVAHGRFNPRLSQDQIEFVQQTSAQLEGNSRLIDELLGQAQVGRMWT